MKQLKHHIEYETGKAIDMESDEVDKLVDTLLDLLQGETVGDILRETSKVLTTSKHLLPFEKRHLQWFQFSLAKVKNDRNLIKD
jgi:hypothetical protein